MNLNYKSFGEGTPVIFLHGLFGMLDNWQTFGKKVADAGYWTFLLDQRAHGKSFSGSEFNYQVLSEDLKVFLDSNWIHESIIIGHSMGGKTAMQFAHDYPDYVEKLVIVDIAPKKYKGGHKKIFEALRSINLEKTSSRQEVFNHLVNKLPHEADSTIQFLLKNLKRQKSGGYEWKMDVDLLYKNYDSILDNIQFNDSIDVETLFVKGDNSNYISEADTGLITSLFTNHEIKNIQQAGHWIHAEKPNELFSSIISFIEK